MAFPFREILDGSTFTTHPIKRDGRIEVMMRTRNGFYRKQDSELEFEINPSTMVELLLRREEVDFKHKVWEISIQERIPFEQAWENFCLNLSKKNKEISRKSSPKNSKKR